MIAQIQIEYLERRCYACGTRWMIEKYRDNITSECPNCAAIDRKVKWLEIQKLTRANAALRGIINRRSK